MPRKSLILAVFVVLVTCVAGVFSYRTKMVQKPVESVQSWQSAVQPMIAQEPEEQSVNTQEPPVATVQNIPLVDTSAWKTYRNEEYGFEVKYPKNASLRIGNPERITSEEDVELLRLMYLLQESTSLAINISIYRNDRSLDLQSISKKEFSPFFGIDKFLTLSSGQQEVFFRETREEDNSLSAVRSLVYTKEHPYFFDLHAVDYSGMSQETEAIFVTFVRNFIIFQ